MSVRDWTLEMPPAWMTGEWECLDLLAEGRLAAGGAALLVDGVLTDGTNVMAVLWASGQRLLRMGPPTEYAVQEHYTGKLPPEDKVIDRMWKVAVNAMIQAKADTEREFGPPPGRGGSR
jgi:hypothetical protein